MSKSNKKYIIANWKMYLSPDESVKAALAVQKKLRVARGVEVVIAPSALVLRELAAKLGKKNVKLAAQNIYWRDFGAFTGEISASEVHGLAEFTLVGHSERRYVFGEQNRDIKKKVAAALRSHLTPVLCIGETRDEKDFGETSEVLYDQILGGLSELAAEDIHKVVIAYEPVWAISGNGNARPCSVEDLTESVRLIRSHLNHLYGKKISENVSVLYGGSVKAENAGEFLAVDGVDGLLVGSASTKADEFLKIIEQA
ncbi:MAG: triose-phosphate isomerase [Candidatus Nomurabacteria bacterium]|jgi:triosephosphate isomerase|nr:triose-phosphate isomerase [Candidatus Nomurabacteria bacterium]